LLVLDALIPRSKFPTVCSGHRVLGRAVSGEIGPEDFTRSERRSRHDERGRQWAPEVCDETQLQSRWQFSKSAEGQLVCTIKRSGAKVAIRLGIIE
jgi:hypothetical protein